MTMRIELETIKLYGGKEGMDQQIADYRAALEAHALTVNVPAPLADSLVEHIVKRYNGEYEIYEYETNLIPGDPNSLTAQVKELKAMVEALMAAKG